MSTNALPCQYQILVSGKLEAYGWPRRWITHRLKTKTKFWHRLDSGQISLKDKMTKKTIFRHKTKKNWFGLFFMNFSGLTRKKNVNPQKHFTETTDWQRTRQTFLWLLRLYILFFRHRTKMDTDKNLDYYIYIDYLTDIRPDYTNGSYQIQVFFNSCRWNDPKDKWLWQFFIYFFDIRLLHD